MAASMPGRRHYDHIVVGAGICGSWATLQLARRGAHVLLLEQFPLPHSRGSSHGQSRGIRRAYTDPYFTGLMEEAYKEWHHLEEQTGVKLVKETGLLCFSDMLESPWLGAIIDSLVAQEAEHEVVSGDKFRQRFPYISFEEDAVGCVDPGAGVLMADKALKEVQGLAVKEGAVIRDGFTVTNVESWHSGKGGVRVEGEGVGQSGVTESYTAQSVVLCPGPWGERILKTVGLSIPLNPMKIPVYYWRTKGDFLPHTFIYEGTKGDHIWGLPALEYPGLAKICLHEGPLVNPDARDAKSTEEIKNLLQEFITNHFPSVEPEVAVEESCIYTCTPDWNPVIDTVPGSENVVFAVGFSGTGFKLGPVTGRMLADLAQGKENKQTEPKLALARLLTKGKL